jgi:hypothetical protein
LFIPFDELVDDDGLLPGGRKRTLIDWSNYRTEQEVETDRTERRPHLPPAPRPAGGRRTSPAAGGTAVDPTAPLPLLPVMLPEPMDLDETPAMPGPDGRRIRSAVLGLFLVGAAAAGGGWWWWTQRNGPEPPPGISTDVLPSAGGAARVARRAATGPATTGPIDSTGLASGANAVTGADSLGRAGAPGSTGAGGTMTDTLGGALTPNATPNAAPNAAPNVQTAVARPAPSADPRVARFDTMADSLEQAIRNFGNRSSDFAVKRLSCRGLGVGYRGADDAYMSLAATHRDARTAIDGARDARFRRLSSLMDNVNASFDSTKCPRP